MKTWRERTTEAIARERRICGVLVWPGRFTDQDRAAWRTFDTCAVGECARAYGLHPLELDDVGDFSYRFLVVVNGIFFDSPRAADRLLDEMEDAALTLKRAARC